MTEIRIDAATLPLAFQEALVRLSAGESVVVERAGEAVARLESCPADRGPGNLRRFVEARLDSEPVGDWFVDAVLEAVDAGNRPAEVPDWAF